VLDRVLVLEMVRVTEAAAIAASKLVGRGDERLRMPLRSKRCARR
jgi:fructose-1,6-bisphosphatase II / sedoheptulose-1,7-bisphosphatase